jgi:flagellar assembly factor FliW
MKVKTTIHGRRETLEVSTEQVYAFDPPLGGFAGLRRYALIPEEGSPVEWLQSLEDPDVAFAVLEPFLFLADYAFELPEADTEALGLSSPDEALVRCVLTLREDPAEITANLLAPIVLSRRTHMGRQLILQDSGLPIRYPILDAVDAELAASA